MKRELKIEIAEALGATPELLPYVPELLADLWALGSRPDVILDLVRPLPLDPEETRVLDLGCGKGAIAIPLAREYGFRVFGVDGFLPFVETACALAQEHGVASLCRFECDDLRHVLAKSKDFDLVIYDAVGSVLGKLDACVRQLRHCLRPGGYMFIHDVFLKATVDKRPSGYEHCETHAKTVDLLREHRDILLREVIFSSDDTRTQNRKNTEHIRRRAERLAEKHPKLEHLFSRYVEDQERESKILETELRTAVWLLQKQGKKIDLRKSV